MAFAVSDQGVTAPFTALHIAAVTSAVHEWGQGLRGLGACLDRAPQDMSRFADSKAVRHISRMMNPPSSRTRGSGHQATPSTAIGRWNA